MAQIYSDLCTRIVLYRVTEIWLKVTQLVSYEMKQTPHNNDNFFAITTTTFADN